MRSLSTRWVVALCVGGIAVLGVVYAIWLRPGESELFRVEAPEAPQAEVDRKRHGNGKDGGQGVDRRPGHRSSPTGGGVGIVGGTGLGATGTPPAASGAVPTGAPSPSSPDANHPDDDRDGGTDPASDQYRDSLSELLARIEAGR